MAERRSSLLDRGMDSIGAPKASKTSGGGNQTIKLVVALVLFAAAGVIFAWSQGWLGGEEAPPPPSQEQLQALEQQKQAAEEALKANKAVISGSE